MKEMNAENILLLKREIMKMYSHDLPTTIYTFLRLKLSPTIKVEEYVPERGNILDLGCGLGIFANILYLTSPERKVLGVDLSSKRIEIAKRVSEQQPQLEFMIGNVNNVTFNGFDIITLIDLLHHMPFVEQDNLLKKVYDNMREGGIVLVKDLEKSPYWKYIFHYIQDSVAYKGARLYFRSAEEIISLLRDIGFVVEYVPLSSGYAYPHVLYRCTKMHK